jgi:putative ribosome biogenesis GTPase RsgA
MHALEFGGWVIDTPGIRVVPPARRAHGQPARPVPGLPAVPVRCHFKGCSH